LGVIIANDHCIQRITRRVTADDKLLLFIDLVFQARAAAFADVGQN
jgi:hypothetical protein